MLPPSAHPLLLDLPVAGLARARLALVRAAHEGGFFLVIGDAEFVGFEAADFVAEAAGFLEFQVAGGLAHPLLQVRYVSAQIMADEMGRILVAGVDDDAVALRDIGQHVRSEEHTSEIQSLMRISYAVFCLNKQKTKPQNKE